MAPRLAWLPKANSKCYSLLCYSLPTADGACVCVCVCPSPSVSLVLCMEMHPLTGGGMVTLNALCISNTHFTSVVFVLNAEYTSNIWHECVCFVPVVCVHPVCTFCLPFTCGACAALWVILYAYHGCLTCGLCVPRRTYLGCHVNVGCSWWCSVHFTTPPAACMLHANTACGTCVCAILGASGPTHRVCCVSTVACAWRGCMCSCSGSRQLRTGLPCASGHPDPGRE